MEAKLLGKKLHRYELSVIHSPAPSNFMLNHSTGKLNITFSCHLGAKRTSQGIVPTPEEGIGFPGENTAQTESQEEGTTATIR